MLRLRKNNGDSNTISILFVTLILFSLTMTIIDISITFSNRNVVLTAAQNGARVAAIYGGTGETDIQKKYGTSATSYCKSAGMSAVECAVYNELMDSKVAIGIKLHKIKCGPAMTQKIGERVWCTVDWEWQGLSGSAMSYVKRIPKTTTTATAEAEVIAQDATWPS